MILFRHCDGGFNGTICSARFCKVRISAGAFRAGPSARAFFLACLCLGLDDLAGGSPNYPPEQAGGGGLRYGRNRSRSGGCVWSNGGCFCYAVAGSSQFESMPGLDRRAQPADRDLRGPGLLLSGRGHRAFSDAGERASSCAAPVGSTALKHLCGELFHLPGRTPQ
jgi:hypothetical protein